MGNRRTAEKPKKANKKLGVLATLVISEFIKGLIRHYFK